MSITNFPYRHYTTMCCSSRVIQCSQQQLRHLLFVVSAVAMLFVAVATPRAVATAPFAAVSFVAVVGAPFGDALVADVIAAVPP